MNKLKHFTCLSLAIIISTACSHRIVRTGYEVNKSDYQDCEIAIQRFDIPETSEATLIGEIKLGESGFSAACSEAHALDILKREGCALHADLIVITEERRPDLWSSCYRCNADFYKYTNSNELISDERYDKRRISDRVSKDRNQNTGMIIGAIVGGLIVGLLLF